MKWRAITFALMCAFSATLYSQISGEEAISAAALLLMKGHELESFLGRMADEEIIRENGLFSDTAINARALNVFNRLINNDAIKRDKFNYTLRVTNSSQVNAYALPGGFIYVNCGLMKVPGMTDDELAFVLAHELAHTNKSHGVSKLKESLLIGLATKILIKDAKLRIAAEIGKQLYSAGRSRDNEREADKIGFEYVKAAGFDTRAPLAFMRRLETISRESKDPFEQLFRTHPPTSERCQTLRSAFINNKYSRDFTLLSNASSEPKREYDANDPAWQKAYKADTGWDVYHLGRDNPFDAGECVWLVYAVRKDLYPRDPSGKGANHGGKWFDRCISMNYDYGNDPKLGAIACWSSSTTGHVALVTRIYPDGKIRIWEANYNKK